MSELDLAVVYGGLSAAAILFMTAMAWTLERFPGLAGKLLKMLGWE